MEKFYSNGKVLLTGEYLVLFGAKALAFPTRYGQDLMFQKHTSPDTLTWKAFSPQGEWFQAVFSLPEFDIKQTSSTGKSMFLKKLLEKACNLGTAPFETGCGYYIETKTNFPINWGLGTSSTLINNIAQLMNVNPFALHKATTKGSGYDIACANQNKPLIYCRKDGKEQIEIQTFNKTFNENLYFVYSGKKKETQNHVNNFLNKPKDLSLQIQKVNEITGAISESDTLEEFQKLIVQHEKLISSVLQEPTLQESTFTNFSGTIKSLGAWGGDFFLAATERESEYVHKYFEHFGLSTIIPFKEMVL